MKKQRPAWMAKILGLIVVLGTSSCDQLCGGLTPSTRGPSGRPNIIVLFMATPGAGGAASGQVYGTYSTGDLCVAARDYLLKQNPAKFAAAGVDFACTSDMYDVMPWTIGERGQ